MQVGSEIRYYDPDESGVIIRSKVNDLWESGDIDREGVLMCSTEMHPDRWFVCDECEKVA